MNICTKFCWNSSTKSKAMSCEIGVSGQQTDGRHHCCTACYYQMCNKNVVITSADVLPTGATLCQLLATSYVWQLFSIVLSVMICTMVNSWMCCVCARLMSWPQLSSAELSVCLSVCAIGMSIHWSSKAWVIMLPVTASIDTADVDNYITYACLMQQTASDNMYRFVESDTAAGTCPYCWSLSVSLPISTPLCYCSTHQ